jgi:hypothetical protein
MALILADRVKETTTTTGTGTVTLLGASTGFQSFAVIGNANTTYYTIAGQGTSEYEVGIGTYTSSGTTLARTTVLASSNANAAVNFSAGTKDVFVTYPAGKSVNLDASGNSTALGIPVSATLTNATGLPISTGVSGLGTGVATALGNNANATSGFATIDGTATLTNKRINPRTSSSASTATLTPDISANDQYNLTAQAVGLTVAAPTGTPVDGNRLIIRILDNGTAQTISWNATYTVIGVTLPTTTTANKMVYVGCIYNSTNTRWDVVAVTTQA